MKCEWCQSELKPGATKCRMCGREVDPELLRKAAEEEAKALASKPVPAAAPVPLAQPVFQAPQQVPQSQAQSQLQVQPQPQSLSGNQEFVPASFADQIPQQAVPQRPLNQVPTNFNSQQPILLGQQPIVLGQQPAMKPPRQKKGLAVAGVVCSFLAMFFLLLIQFITFDDASVKSYVARFDFWYLGLITGGILLLLGIIFLCCRISKKNCRALVITGLSFAVIGVVLLCISSSHYSDYHDKYQYGRSYSRVAEYLDNLKKYGDDD